MIWDGSVASTE